MQMCMSMCEYGLYLIYSSRRLGLLKRVLDSNSAWLLGLIVDQWDAPKGWTKEVRKDLESLAKLEVGVTPIGIQMIALAKEATKTTWKARIKTAAAAAVKLILFSSSLSKYLM